MQAGSLLEARRSAWQHCSTSHNACMTVSVKHPGPFGQRRVTAPLQQSRSCRARITFRGPLRCRSQAQDTKERQAERTESSNGHLSNGASSNGSHSDGKGSNGSGNGSVSQQYESSASQESLGAPGSKKSGQASQTKGTLDHLLESSRQVGCGQSSHPFKFVDWQSFSSGCLSF